MADKTIGELDAVKIGELPPAPDIYDDTKIPVEQQGEAMHMTGALWKEYAREATKGLAAEAAESAKNAAESADKAKESETAAAGSAGKAKEYEGAAADSAAAALASEQAAEQSKQAAAKSEENAQNSADASEASAQRAESAAETAAQDAAQKAVEDAQELLSGYVSDAQTAEQNAETAQTAAENARDKATEAQQAAEGAKDKALEAQTATEGYKDDALEAQGLAETAREGAESAQQAAEGYSTSASKSASEAAQSADTAKQYSGNPPRISDHGTWEIWNAENGNYEDTGKKSIATWDKTYTTVAEMEADKENQPVNTIAIISSDVEQVDNAKIYIKGSDGTWHYLADLSGMQGVGIEGVSKTDGDGSPGTKDTYTVTLTDNRTYTFDVYNGADGEGAGDMLTATYDPDGDGKVKSADAADTANEANHLTGFNAGKTGNVAWGIQEGTTVYNSGATSDSGAGGCDFEFRKDCPSGGKLSLKVDGEFYAAEGNSRCYHEGDVIPEATHATTADTAAKLGTETVGGATTPIYLKAGVPTAGTSLDTKQDKLAGAATQVTLGDGTYKNITEFGKVASAATADSASKLGSKSVGNTRVPIHLTDGAPTAGESITKVLWVNTGLATFTDETNANIKFRGDLATIKSEAGVSQVIVGDTIIRSGSRFLQVLKVDDTYVYTGNIIVPERDDTKLPLAGGTVTGTLVLSKNTDASGTANNSPALIVGGPATGAHMELDANEIMAKSNGTTTAQLNINTDGGLVQIGGALTVKGVITPSGGITGYAKAPTAVTLTLKSASWSGTTQAVACNGVVADETKQEVSICPKVSDFKTYMDAGIYVSAVAANQLTFTCETKPTADITVYVKIQNF